MLCQEYYAKLQERLGEVYACETDRIVEAARSIAASIANDGVLHIFGCGHSHMLAEEAFYRAGGLVQVNPILDSAVMLHEGAVKSSAVERMTGYASHILDRYTVRKGDVLLVFSTSGINSLPIEMAQAARDKGLKVVVVTSFAYKEIPSRHKDGKHLLDMGDIIINNHVPVGDALLSVEGVDDSIAPSSTILSGLILNMIIAQIAEELLALGVKPKYFTSGNVPGGSEWNKQYTSEYRERIKLL